MRYVDRDRRRIVLDRATPEGNFSFPHLGCSRTKNRPWIFPALGPERSDLRGKAVARAWADSSALRSGGTRTRRLHLFRAGVVFRRTDIAGGHRDAARRGRRGIARSSPSCARSFCSQLPFAQDGQRKMKARLASADAVGITGYGHYVPYLRVEMKTFAEQWGVPAQLERMYRLNGRNRVAVNAADEDAVTLAVAAAERALATLPKEARVAWVLVGSESHPYAVKPTSVIVAEAL